jgi:hypothetical protein
MNIQKVRRLLSDLKKLQAITDRIVTDFEDLLKSEELEKAKRRKGKASIPADDKLRNEWKRIQEEKRKGKEIKIVLDELFQDKTKAYMTAFLKANSLPIPAKKSKDKIVQQLQSLLHVGTTITGR